MVSIGAVQVRFDSAELDASLIIDEAENDPARRRTSGGTAQAVSA
jgi:hypothetical protein